MEYPNATYSAGMEEETNRPNYKSRIGDGTHEGIHPGQEMEHLSELKQVASDHAKEQAAISGTPQKGTTASVAQSALGKYASALGTEINMPGNIVQASINFADHPVNEEKLLRELKEEAKQRERYETNTQGYIDQASPAAKVQAAADKLEKVVNQDKGLE